MAGPSPHKTESTCPTEKAWRHTIRHGVPLLLHVLLRLPQLLLVLLLLLLCLQLSRAICCQVGRSLLECNESRRSFKSDNVRLSRKILMICNMSHPKERIYKECNLSRTRACARARARTRASMARTCRDSTLRATVPDLNTD
jgi:hypothetical protein